jgi:hypothetical protein
MDAAGAASVWYIMSKPIRTPLSKWRWMGGGCGEWGECVWIHCEQTVMTPLYKGAPCKSAKAITFLHEGFPGDSSAKN